MDFSGTIREMNKAFKTTFGYSDEDLIGRNFNILFTESDRSINIPEREIENTIATGAADDNNYLVIKDGSRVWVTGESVIVKDDDGVGCIVKVIHNIQAQKLLERFLSESNVVLDGIFDTITHTALAVVDGRLEITRVNDIFLRLFDLNRDEIIGKRLTDLKQLFSINSEGMRQHFRDMVVKNESLKGVQFELQKLSGETISVNIYSKLIESENAEKRILLVINNLEA